MPGRPLRWILLLACGSAAALLISLAVHALWPAWRGRTEPLHSTMEAVGGLASIAMAVVLFQRRDASDGGITQVTAPGFLGMGILEVFHAVADPGNGFVLLRNMASLVGGAGFGLVWFSDTSRNEWGKPWLPLVVTAGALTFGAWTLAFHAQIPEMIRNGEFTPTAVAPQSLACLLFFAAAVRFLGHYRRSGRSEEYLFAVLAFLFGLAELVFMYSAPWDNRWWFWHLLRLTAYLTVLWYMSRGYARMISDLQLSLAQTQRAKEMAGRSERQLRRVLDEREQMAQSLHDSSIQSIFAIGLSLERCRRLVTVDSDEVHKQLGAAIADLKKVIRDLRGYLVGLEPPIANGRELEAALTSLIASLEGSHRIHVHLAVNPLAADRVTPEQAAHFLSIVQEALSNSLRHSGARTGHVSLQLEDGCVRLVVEDTGAGFHASAIHGEGHGLKNMEARARKLGGRFQVLSTPGHGTRIIVDLPGEPTHAPA